jgi:hypothetical protein
VPFISSYTVDFTDTLLRSDPLALSHAPAQCFVSRILNFPMVHLSFFNASGASLPCREPSGVSLFLPASQETARLGQRPTTLGRLGRKQGYVSVPDRVFEQLGIPARY